MSYMKGYKKVRKKPGYKVWKNTGDATTRHKPRPKNNDCR